MMMEARPALIVLLNVTLKQRTWNKTSISTYLLRCLVSLCPWKKFWIRVPCSESHEEVKILIVTYKKNSKTRLHYSGDKRARDYRHFHLILMHGVSWDWYKHMWVQGRIIFFMLLSASGTFRAFPCLDPSDGARRFRMWSTLVTQSTEV